MRAFEQAGFTPPDVVAAQAEPDPDFPTVTFPNPEEPGALDLALAQARRSGADLVLANDPDGDRLAVAVPGPDGGWQTLTGDQVGCAARRLPAGCHARPSRAPATGCVVTTIVSSTLLSRIAAAAGAQYAETLTGFKWIVRAGESPRQPVRLRLRGGARVRGRRDRAGQGRDRGRPGAARPRGAGPVPRRVAARRLRRAGDRARRAPDRPGHGRHRGTGRRHGAAAGGAAGGVRRGEGARRPPT